MSDTQERERLARLLFSVMKKERGGRGEFEHNRVAFFAMADAILADRAAGPAQDVEKVLTDHSGHPQMGRCRCGWSFSKPVDDGLDYAESFARGHAVHVASLIRPAPIASEQELVEQRAIGHGEGQDYVMREVARILGLPEDAGQQVFTELDALMRRPAATVDVERLRTTIRGTILVTTPLRCPTDEEADAIVKVVCAALSAPAKEGEK